MARKLVQELYEHRSLLEGTCSYTSCNLSPSPSSLETNVNSKLGIKFDTDTNFLENINSIDSIFQNDGFYRIDAQTGEVFTVAELTGKGRQVSFLKCVPHTRSKGSNSKSIF